MDPQDLKIDREMDYAVDYEITDGGRSLACEGGGEIHGRHLLAHVKGLVAARPDVELKQINRGIFSVRSGREVVTFAARLLRPVEGERVTAWCEECRESHYGTVVEVDKEAERYRMDAIDGPGDVHEGTWKDIIAIDPAPAE
ncbi:hypothetical protein AB0A05_26845 [Streptomyces sp. NPDC046374]|uniref:hypothetical protein n=1 Tax=Streptomyces sp. NPDC046374 TaxID=3154917 RepID=UPI0033D3A269